MNPYEVLGVSDNADEETVKRAYKELVKKYHPDKYVNNPLADLAAEKMKEINKAYDMIMKKGSTGQSTGGYSSYGGGGGYTNAQPSFSMVRRLINLNHTMQALMMVQNLPKTAEWYYLAGLANVKSGRYTDGVRYMEQAVRMEPNNSEYSDTLNIIRNRTTYYNTGGGGMYTTGGGCPLPCLCLPCICGGGPGPCC